MKEKKPAKRIKTMKVKVTRSPVPQGRISKEALDRYKTHLPVTSGHVKGLVSGGKRKTKIKSGKRKK